jgi:WD40 repeat protein
VIEFRKIEIKEFPRARKPQRGTKVLDAPERVMRGDAGWLAEVAFTADGASLISGSRNYFVTWSKTAGAHVHGGGNSVRLWDVATGEQRFALPNRLGRGGFPQVALSPNNRFAAVAPYVVEGGPQRHGLTIWDLESRQLTQSFPLLPENIGVVRPWFSSDGQSVLAFRGDGTVHVLSLAGQKETKQLKLLGEPGNNMLRCVCLSRDRKHVYGGTARGVIGVWSMANGNPVKDLRGHTGPITSLAVSRDDKFLVSVSEDGTARLWSLSSAREVRRFDLSGDRVVSAVFAGKSTRVVTGTLDEAAIVWDTAAGKQLCRFEGHDGPGTCVDVSPDGRLLATGSDDRTIRVWKMPD